MGISFIHNEIITEARQTTKTLFRT